MGKRRKFFHWILVAFFVMFSISGFAVGSVIAGLLNLVLAAIALPFGTVYELKGKRRAAKWIVSIVLVCICMASLGRQSSRANPTADAGKGSTGSVATEDVASEQTAVAATTETAAYRQV